MKLYLNTTPCQYVNSKTKKAIDHINHTTAIACEPNSGVKGIHYMTIIFTNNNKIEGRQWNIRLGDDNPIRKISILSSDKNRAHFNKVSDFFEYHRVIKKADDLIDVLVVCNNNIRNNDITEIIETLTGKIPNVKYDFNHIGIKDFKFTVMFDEADKPPNLNHSLKFIENFKSNNYDNYIDSIHLISATVYENFWKKMKKIGINKLKNLKNDIDGEIPSPEYLLKDYQTLEEHNIIHVNEDLKPCEYIKHIYETKIKLNKERLPLRIFAPPTKLTNDHEKIKKYFLEHNFIVVIINGKSKDIYFSNEINISINDFNKKYFPKKKDVEMYNTLTKLHNLYSSTNIVITGFNCIERGITFQTDGFNFTDMIIPPIKDIATSVQMIGRANGGKKYVHKHNIYIQEDHYNNIEKRINFTMNLIKSNPEEISETDFRDKTEKEKDMVRWTVPVSIPLTEEEYLNVTKKYRNNQYIAKRNKSIIFDLLNKKKIDINLEGYDTGQFTEPSIEEKEGKKSPWSLIIQTILNHVNENKIYNSDNKKLKEKNKKVFSIYFDKKNYNLIIVRYNGDIPLE